MLEIRVLAPDDWTTWRSLRLAALSEAPYAFCTRLADWEGDNDREERWRARLAIPGSRNVMAVLDGEPAGVVSGVPHAEDGVVELISMWVAPAARGRGVGDALVRDVEQWAQRVGGHVLRLEVAEDNAAACALYERNGWACTDGYGGLMGDGVRRRRVMTKPLVDA